MKKRFIDTALVVAMIVLTVFAVSIVTGCDSGDVTNGNNTIMDTIGKAYSGQKAETPAHESVVEDDSIFLKEYEAQQALKFFEELSLYIGTDSREETEYGEKSFDGEPFRRDVKKVSRVFEDGVTLTLLLAQQRSSVSVEGNMTVECRYIDSMEFANLSHYLIMTLSIDSSDDISDVLRLGISVPGSTKFNEKAYIAKGLATAVEEKMSAGERVTKIRWEYNSPSMWISFSDGELMQYDCNTAYTLSKE